VTPSHLMDAGLFDFKGLQATGVSDAAGDIAFDEAPCTATDGSREDGSPMQLVRFADD